MKNNTPNKQEEHLCKNCFTEWVTKEDNCFTCKDLENRRLKDLSKFLKRVTGVLK